MREGFRVKGILGGPCLPLQHFNTVGFLFSECKELKQTSLSKGIRGQPRFGRLTTRDSLSILDPGQLPFFIPTTKASILQ